MAGVIGISKWTTTKVTVTTSGQELVAANQSRICLVIQNIKTKTVYFHHDGDATAESDLMLVGGQKEIWDGAGVCRGQVKAITKSSSADVIVVEGT